MNLTSQSLILRSGVNHRPEYEDCGPVEGAAGLFVFRRYPDDSPLSQVRTRDGRHGVRCLLLLSVEPATAPSGISRVRAAVRCARRWHGLNIPIGRDPDALDEFEAAGAAAPTAQSVAILRRARKPLGFDLTDDYTYDRGEEVFFDSNGHIVTPVQILEDLYLRHCRTCDWRFLLRWKFGSGVRWLVQRAVWRGQDVLMWALFNFYDIELVDEKLRSPFHKYRFREFRRMTVPTDDRSQFFGFQSSRKSFFTNLVVVVVLCAGLYWIAPRTGLLRAVYNNTALTTVALGFGFLLADVMGPKLLVGGICALSRLREWTAFFTREVHV